MPRYGLTRPRLFCHAPISADKVEKT